MSICRYTVKMLLNHEFFVEGVKIEALPQQGGETSSLLHLRMEVPTKETSKKNNQESVEFTYDIDKDVPEVVVARMVRMGGSLSLGRERRAIGRFAHSSRLLSTLLWSTTRSCSKLPNTKLVVVTILS